MIINLNVTANITKNNIGTQFVSTVKKIVCTISEYL